MATTPSRTPASSDERFIDRGVAFAPLRASRQDRAVERRHAGWLTDASGVRVPCDADNGGGVVGPAVAADVDAAPVGADGEPLTARQGARVHTRQDDRG